MKDNKKCFYKHTNDRRKGKNKLGSLLDAGGNLVTADGQKAEVFNTFFASVFSRNTVCPQDNYPPGLVDGFREQDGPLLSWRRQSENC